MNSLQGQLLVASPELSDPNFFHTVVFLTQHTEEGTLGLVLNRPSNVELKEVWGKLSESECRYRGALFGGGPCPGPLMAIHTNASLGDDEVIAGVFHTASKENLESLAGQEAECQARFFAGYSGWAAGQLEAEMEQGGWRTLPATAEHLFQPADDLWETVNREIAARTLLDDLKIKHVPPDLRMN